MSELRTVPRVTKMAKYLAAVKGSQLNVTQHRVLCVLREMNTTAQIIAALTGIKDTKVRTALNELHVMNLASITEVRKTGARPKNFWGLHDEFRSMHKVPTYPTAVQEAALATAAKKGGRSLDMDETAAVLWGSAETQQRGRVDVLEEIAFTLKKTPILSRAAGDLAARSQTEAGGFVTPSFDINDYVEED